MDRYAECFEEKCQCKNGYFLKSGICGKFQCVGLQITSSLVVSGVYSVMLPILLETVKINLLHRLHDCVFNIIFSLFSIIV